MIIQFATFETGSFTTQFSNNTKSKDKAETTGFFNDSNIDDSSQEIVPIVSLKRGLAKPFCCFHHPTTLSYHPQVYNYRYFYNIVGHETSNCSNCRQ
jgi:hypothetical protein